MRRLARCAGAASSTRAASTRRRGSPAACWRRCAGTCSAARRRTRAGADRPLGAGGGRPACRARARGRLKPLLRVCGAERSGRVRARNARLDRFPRMTAQAIVTGGAGFIGSHLVDALLADGYEVTVIDDLSSGDARRVAGAARLLELDIVDRAAVVAVVEEAKPETVFHLAAQSSVVVSVENPGRDCEVNVQGTLNVVDAATKQNIPVVFTSTGGALYGDEAPRPTDERQIPHRSRPTARRSWRGRPTSGPGRARRACPTRSAGWATSTARARARMARPGSCDLHASPAHGAGAEAVRARHADARLRVRRRCRQRAARRGRARRAPSISPPAWRPT